jgi:MFS family permease
MTTFIAAGIIPAFEQLSEDLGVSLAEASYLTSIQILVLGIAPIFWKPISNRFGRRPVWLISTFGSMICNIGNAESYTYASQLVTRALVAFFISPAIAISSVVVTETFFSKERGQKMGIWTLMVTLGYVFPPTTGQVLFMLTGYCRPSVGPFLMGFVADHTHGWQWIYWIFAITNGMQFVLYFFFSPETLYVRNRVDSTTSKSPFQRKYLNFGKIGPRPLAAADFLTPIKLFAYPSIVIPAISYAITFNFASILCTVETPQIFAPKFHFNAQQIGLQFIGPIIGSSLGEVLGGHGSDFWMRRKNAQLGRSRHAAPEHRIWLSYVGFATVICGLVVFTVQADRIQSYDVSPIVGFAIAAFGNQIITTVLITYTVDCHHEHSASIGVFINLLRSTWGFLGMPSSLLLTCPLQFTLLHPQPLCLALTLQRPLLVPLHVQQPRPQWKRRLSGGNRCCVCTSTYNLHPVERRVDSEEERGHG